MYKFSHKGLTTYMAFYREVFSSSSWPLGSCFGPWKCKGELLLNCGPAHAEATWGLLSVLKLPYWFMFIFFCTTDLCKNFFHYDVAQVLAKNKYILNTQLVELKVVHGAIMPNLNIHQNF
jgi:hypothetical protein